jgi:putative transcriptional regulator
MRQLRPSLSVAAASNLLIMKSGSKKKQSGQVTSLEGQLLIAMPSMTDKRFARSVIYVCAHTPKGAMGIIINQRAEHISFPELLEQLKILDDGDDPSVPAELRDINVHVGGPVETGRGFVLHSADYSADDSTMVIDETVSLTATIDILKAMADGSGPEHAILALGYAGWRAGQLETEIQANGWLHCPSDIDLLFHGDLDDKYTRAMLKIGIDPSHLVCDAGHA